MTTRATDNRKRPLQRDRELTEVGEDPDPRFTFANEGTFLAWNRTALALIAGGLAAAELLKTDPAELGLAVAVPLIVVGRRSRAHELLPLGDERAADAARPPAHLLEAGSIARGGNRRSGDPAWTGARGGWIVFRRGRNLFRIRPEGSGLRRLTRRGGAEPAWSPHGTRIAFTRKGNVYLMRPDGSRLRRLTRKGGLAPVWSPNGKRMLFRRRHGLWIMRSSGRAPRPLISGDVDVGRFDWGRQP